MRSIGESGGKIPLVISREVATRWHSPGVSAASVSSIACSEARSPQYWIPQHVFLCATHDGVVFLDLRRDRYFGLGMESARALAGIVDGWPIQRFSTQDQEDVSSEKATNTAEQLTAAGLLTRDEVAGKPVSVVRLHEMETMVALGQDSVVQARIRFGDVANFVIASIVAALALRYRSLESVVRRVRTRKERRLKATDGFDACRAAELVVIFRCLRTYGFTAKNHCLFHALALINFLARYEVFPMWVIGVKTAPFEAHSWVQQENQVLDGTPERVCFYTPVMAV